MIFQSREKQQNATIISMQQLMACNNYWKNNKMQQLVACKINGMQQLMQEKQNTTTGGPARAKK